MKIANNSMTKSWVEQGTSVRAARDEALRVLLPAEFLPDSVLAFAEVIDERRTTNGEASREIIAFADGLSARILKEATRRIREVMRSTEAAVLKQRLGGISTPAPAELPQPDLRTLFDPAELIPTGLAERLWTRLRTKEVVALRSAVRDLRGGLEGAASLLESRAPFGKIEEGTQSAQESLKADLQNFLLSVDLYRDGVFSINTKELLERLGLGGKFEALSTFTDVDKENFVQNALSQIFPGFQELVSDSLVQLVSIGKSISEVRRDIGEFKISSPGVLSDAVSQVIRIKSEELYERTSKLLQEEYAVLQHRMAIQMQNEISLARRHFEEETANIRRSRNSRLAVVAVGTGFLVGLIVLAGFSLNRDMPSTIFANLAAGVISGLAGSAIGAWIEKIRYNFPQRIRAVEDDLTLALRTSVSIAVDREIDAWRPAAISVSRLRSAIEEQIYEAIDIDPDDWAQTSHDQLERLRQMSAIYRETRSEFVALIDKVVNRVSAFFEDISANLAKLNEVAQSIKTRSIEPSFKLLADTKQRLQDVRFKIEQVTFT